MAVGAVRLGVYIVYVFALSHVDSRLGRAAELVVVAVGEVSSENHLMHVVVTSLDCFTGNGGNTVVVPLAAVDDSFGDADDLVYVLLFVTVVTSVNSHIF